MVIIVFYSCSEQGNTRFTRDSTNNDDIIINVTMPTVGWNQQFGDSNISVDLSRTVANSFTLDTSKLSSTVLRLCQNHL